jgi:cytochrome c553
MKKLTLACLIALAPLSNAAETSSLVGDAEAGKQKSIVCSTCHGADGNTSLMPDYPKLGGQHAKYALSQLQQFKSGVRNNAIMAGQVGALSDQDMADLAAYYATQPLPVGSASEDLVEQGQLIYRAGIASKGVSACIACHGPQGLGNPAAKYPSLSGQGQAYTLKQLKDYASGERVGSHPTTNQIIMIDIAKKLSESEMKAVADYVSGLH